LVGSGHEEINPGGGSGEFSGARELFDHNDDASDYDNDDDNHPKAKCDPGPDDRLEPITAHAKSGSEVTTEANWRAETG
jgi:hypothetical protein